MGGGGSQEAAEPGRAWDLLLMFGLMLIVINLTVSLDWFGLPLLGDRPEETTIPVEMTGSFAAAGIREFDLGRGGGIQGEVNVLTDGALVDVYVVDEEVWEKFLESGATILNRNNSVYFRPGVDRQAGLDRDEFEVDERGTYHVIVVVDEVEGEETHVEIEYYLRRSFRMLDMTPAAIGLVLAGLGYYATRINPDFLVDPSLAGERPPVKEETMKSPVSDEEPAEAALVEDDDDEMLTAAIVED